MNTKKLQNTPFERCLRFISFKDRTIAEIRGFLQKKEYNDLVINDTINKLIEYDYLNESKLLVNMAYYNKNSNRFSRYRILYDLRRRGMEEEVLKNFFEYFSDEDEMKCCEYQFEKAYRQYKQLSSFQKKTKIYNALQRKGFKSDTIAQTISKIWDEDNEREQDNEEAQLDEITRLIKKYEKANSHRMKSKKILVEKTVQYLMRKGYSYSLIKRAVENYYDHTNEDIYSDF